MRSFSLTREPFAGAADREFYFSTPALTARLEELCRAIEHGHVLLVDDEGSGKSTMLDDFAEATAERWRVFRFRAREHQNAEEFAHALISTFGLPLREPVAAELRDADTVLELLTTRSQLAVIVMDDVHRLESDALEQLLYLTKRWQGYSVRFLICAEPDLLEKLGSLPGGRRFYASVTSLEMPRFDHEQVGDYLHMCLFRAGLVGDSPFDPALVAQVAERARGLVGAIDPIARELLDQAGNGSNRAGDGASRGVSRRWPVAVVAAAGLGALLVVAVPAKPTSPNEVQAQDHAGMFRSNITPAPSDSDADVERRSAPADLPGP
jgi:type II secretory pathway predicted ATPase ExeA